MPSHIVFSSKEEADAFVATTDKEMNYPEPFEMFCQVGGGIHASWELGRTLHYCTPAINNDGDKWMVLFTDCVELPEGAIAVESLPDDWQPVSEMAMNEGG